MYDNENYAAKLQVKGGQPKVATITMTKTMTG